METRALAIALFYAVGTAIGGITGPLLFSQLVSSHSFKQVFWGYLLGAALMAGAGVVEAVLGLEVAGERLEEIAPPLTAVEQAPQQRRRPRLGPSQTQASWSRQPMSSSRAVSDRELENEIETIVRVLGESGPVSRGQLFTLARARFWGPGRFSRAVRTALGRGRIRALPRGRFEIAPRPGSGSS
jgi:MFS family permease